MILGAYQYGDVVWCHDYHLMLLPSKLKEEHSDMKVGWFLHTPFPSSEIYRMLPVREELLLSVLSADLVGFTHMIMPAILFQLVLAFLDSKARLRGSKITAILHAWLHSP